jgi:hypothetical protein
MPHTRRRRFGLLLPALGLFAGAPLISSAQDPAPAYPQVEMHGRLHTQAYFYDNEEYADDVGARSSFIIRRARFNVIARLSERVTVSVMPTYENARGRGDFRLRDAYADLLLSRPESPTSFTLRVGQEKRPFSRLELTSSNSLIALERGAGQGLVPVQANDLFIAAGFAAHDIGASLLVESGAFALQVGAYNGAGETNRDPNDAKSFGARATFDLSPKLSVGGAVFSHDGIVATDSSFRNTAFELDAQWGRPGAPGLYVLGEVLQGEPFAAGDRTMRGISGVLAYHLRRPGERPALYAIEPALRVDVADPDTNSDDDGATLIAGALGLYLTPRAQLRVAVEHQAFQTDGAPSITGLRSAVFVYF